MPTTQSSADEILIKILLLPLLHFLHACDRLHRSGMNANSNPRCHPYRALAVGQQKLPDGLFQTATEGVKLARWLIQKVQSVGGDLLVVARVERLSCGVYQKDLCISQSFWPCSHTRSLPILFAREIDRFPYQVLGLVAASFRFSY